jgi:hypothetical protein
MRPHESPELNLDRLNHVTDSTGIRQHANFTVPNPSERYWTGDNAAELILAVLLRSRNETNRRKTRRRRVAREPHSCVGLSLSSHERPPLK